MKLSEIDLEKFSDELLEEEQRLQKDAWSARKAYADSAVGFDRGPSYEAAAEVVGGIARALRRLL